VHCHIFNGSDLPIRGFVEEVVLSLPDNALSIAPDALVTLVSAVIKGQAISAHDEAAQLRAGTHVPTVSAHQSDDNLFRSRVGQAIERLQSPPTTNSEARPGSTPLESVEPMTRAHLNQAFQHFGAIGRAAPSAARPQSDSAQPQSAFSASEITDGIISAGGVVYGVLWLGCLLTLNRLELAQRLAGLPSQDAADVRVFLPAMVDYSYWLQDFEVCPYSDQIDVMTQIAKVQGRPYGVHAWASYCPWRQIVDKHQLAAIQHAVMRGGLIGVKLYPPIGFYPTGNAQAVVNGEVYPTELTKEPRYGRQLDDNLNALYQWCSAKGVPLLAHCSFSQYTSTSAGFRAAPEGWKAVLRRYPNLRLNIGHCGGLWFVPTSASKRPPDPPWTQRTLEILNSQSFEHVAADIADYSTMIESGATSQQANEETMRAMRQWLDPATHSLARTRLMYGTDWSLLAQVHPRDANYYGAMKAQIPDQLGLSSAETAGFIGGNAARFLGLALEANVKPPTRQRLESFYKRNHLDQTLLQLWDV
jgi:predicted TIM-barrel fold metal-dependent hydrolase